MKRVQVKSSGIKKALKKYDYPSALAEYIWNAFDANATEVNIEFSSTELGAIIGLKVIDNGYGISNSLKFEPIFESDKVIDPDAHRSSSSIRGKDGFGRLTFFRFAESARWETIFKGNDDRYFTYTIEINSDKLDGYTASEKVKSSNRKSGTIVSFDGIYAITIQNFETDIKDYLCRSFSWFLELNSSKQLSIKINGISLAYKELLIVDKISDKYEIENVEFDFQYIRWSKGLAGEYSRYYLINTQGEEKFTKTTTFNNKGDKFYHSIFIRSKLFDNSQVHLYETPLFKDTPEGKIYKEFLKRLENFLRDKRREFMKTASDELVTNFEKNGVFPKFGTNTWDKHRKSELEDVIRSLYCVEPKIFSNLNQEQKKIFVRFINIILDDGERDKIFNIIEEVVNLSSLDLHQLSESLKISSLSNIVKTIQLLEDRYKVVQNLKKMVFDHDMKANERDHIQKIIEQHYWIFGEEYTLLTAEEPDFEEALRRHSYLLTGDANKKKIDHPDKNKEMDIFMVRQMVGIDKIQHIIVELKHPKINLGKKELDQVKSYMDVILKQDEFNASNMSWIYYLVGNDFSDSEYIEGEIENAERHGESSLAYLRKSHKIYVKKWSEIFVEFDLKYKFLYEKLSLERNMIVKGETTTSILNESTQSSARKEGPINIPKLSVVNSIPF